MMATAASPHATRMIMEATSRLLRVMVYPRRQPWPLRADSSSRLSQAVAHPPDGVHQRRIVTIDLLAQIGDVRLDDIRVALEVVVPHRVENLRLRQHAAGIDQQVPEEAEL